MDRFFSQLGLFRSTFPNPIDTESYVSKDHVERHGNVKRFGNSTGLASDSGSSLVHLDNFLNLVEPQFIHPPNGLLIPTLRMEEHTVHGKISVSGHW